MSPMRNGTRIKMICIAAINTTRDTIDSDRIHPTICRMYIV